MADGQNSPFIEAKKELTENKGRFTTVAATTFGTVFLAEIGDKTQLATLLLSAESGQPITVFAGAALALICSSLVGVLLGQWLAEILPPERFGQMAGLLMITLGLWLGSQAIQSFIQEAHRS